MTKYWKPNLGDIVWMNMPDHNKPKGKVIGFVSEGRVRAGQPIVENEEGFFAIHEMFLLPFPYGGKEWQQACDDGLVEGFEGKLGIL